MERDRERKTEFQTQSLANTKVPAIVCYFQNCLWNDSVHVYELKFPVASNLICWLDIYSHQSTVTAEAGCAGQNGSVIFSCVSMCDVWCNSTTRTLKFNIPTWIKLKCWNEENMLSVLVNRFSDTLLDCVSLSYLMSSIVSHPGPGHDVSRPRKVAQTSLSSACSFWGILKCFPGKMGDETPPAWSGSALGSTPSVSCLENLLRETFRHSIGSFQLEGAAVLLWAPFLISNLLTLILRLSQTPCKRKPFQATWIHNLLL